MRKWKRIETADGPRFRSEMAAHEVVLLRNLVGSVVSMLDERQAAIPPDELEQITGIRSGNTRRPDDATMQRLLPDFHRPDERPVDGPPDPEDLNAALRGLHEPAIIDAKRLAAQQVLATIPSGGGRFELTEEQANSWIAAVNDIRLSLGTILGIGPDGPEQLPPGDPKAGHLSVYQWLTGLQEYLVLALMGRSR